MKPKISVIMGIYNTNDKDMLTKSIGSILNQSYRDFEFIICDDGSTDGTMDLLRKEFSFDSRIKLIRNENNKGLAFTLNVCLESAQGDYIARMDADDYSFPNRFEEQINFLENNKEFSMVGSNVKLFDDQGEWGERLTKEFPTKESFLFGTPFIHPSIVIKKESLIRLGGYKTEKETLRCEDYELFMRLYSNGEKGYNIQKNLLGYREDKNAYSRRKYKFRIDEAKVRYKGFKSLDLMPKGFFYVLKPLVVGIVPQKVLSLLRKEGI